MRKTLFGVGLLVLAGWVLLQGNFGIPLIDFNFWPMLVVLGFAYFAIENFWRGNLSGGIILAIISLIVANSSYHFLPISSGTIFLAGILASIGIGLIFKPKRIWGIYHGQNARRVINGDINFGSGTRYIHSDDLGMLRFILTMLPLKETLQLLILMYLLGMLHYMYQVIGV